LLSKDPSLTIDDGVTVSQYRSQTNYGNSHGFLGERTATRYYRDCPVLVQDGSCKQRDGEYSVVRAKSDLLSTDLLVERAAQAALMRKGAREFQSQEAAVLFNPPMARQLWKYVLSAISGGRIYRQQSFLANALSTKIMPEFISLVEDPWRHRGLGSAVFDDEGVATQEQSFVENGVLKSLILGSYSARKLGMKSTGNAGGVRNLIVTGGAQSLPSMMRDMGEGLYVTELMGNGVDVTTGQLSLGAFGYWIEGGEIAYPVQGITIASDLSSLLQRIHAVGADLDFRSSIITGSLWVNKMMVGGV
jgi:PmbA protein